MNTPPAKAERTALHAASYTRGRQATGLADLVQAHGHLHAALQASLSCLQQAAAFTKKRAPGHHRLIAALIAIRAVLHVEAPIRDPQHLHLRQAPAQVQVSKIRNPTTPKQAAYLREVYERLADEEREWCRGQIGAGGF